MGVWAVWVGGVGVCVGVCVGGGGVARIFGKVVQDALKAGGGGSACAEGVISLGPTKRSQGGVSRSCEGLGPCSQVGGGGCKDVWKSGTGCTEDCRRSRVCVCGGGGCKDWYREVKRSRQQADWRVLYPKPKLTKTQNRWGFVSLRRKHAGRREGNCGGVVDTSPH